MTLEHTQLYIPHRNTAFSLQIPSVKSYRRLTGCKIKGAKLQQEEKSSRRVGFIAL